MLGVSKSNQRSNTFCYVDSFLTSRKNILSVAEAVFGLVHFMYRVSIFICTVSENVPIFFPSRYVTLFYIYPDQWGVKVACWIFVSPF